MGELNGFIVFDSAGVRLFILLIALRYIGSIEPDGEPVTPVPMESIFFLINIRQNFSGTASYEHDASHGRF